MTRQIFVTGTDTDAGKTFCACALTYALRKHGLSVRPYKPIASGVFNRTLFIVLVRKCKRS